MIAVANERRWWNGGKLVGEEGRYTGNNLANGVGTMRSGGVRLQSSIRSGGVRLQASIRGGGVWFQSSIFGGNDNSKMM
ncbi:hypothetical protein L2E82_41564 [Cichorium intybus]|uniref:Uncharacterized protein n=1 Tax=Cichorium intybus TaxID=13427 RepID=A0ACB9ASN2_CICIN|nr:hypothetical protein L2E82_41564 [Cichorium intybus]